MFVIGPIAERPSRIADQFDAASWPSELIAPIPVIATRRMLLSEVRRTDTSNYLRRQKLEPRSTRRRRKQADGRTFGRARSRLTPSDDVPGRTDVCTAV